MFERFTLWAGVFVGTRLFFLLAATLALVAIGSVISGNEVFIAVTNISISILTLLLLPVLQGTQNRDGAALQAKLDELINVNNDARNDLIGLEQHKVEEIEEIRVGN